MEENKFKFPTETVELPSKGLVYPSSSPLSKGSVEMKYMTAKEEDILTNQAYIKKGVVFDKLLKSLIITDGVNLDDLIVGDKNALLVAARVLGYGGDYKFSLYGTEYEVDLTTLENKFFGNEDFEKGKNEFNFTLPHSKVEITFKLMDGKVEKSVDAELEGLKKINKDLSPELSTRLKHLILSVGGNYEQKDVREFVDNYLLAKDSRALRDYIKSFQPDVNMTINHVDADGFEEEVTIPVTLNFFWPES